ncbi:MAG: hypothetical protein PHV95_01595 [Eubacteriales bacterium]|nr:hypothetical protein [Eubacteriales bacterium]
MVTAVSSLLLAGCEPDYETIDGTPLSSKPGKYYETYNEALNFTIRETLRLAEENNWEKEYEGAVYQFKDNLNKFYSATGFSGDSQKVKVAPSVLENDNCIILADIHTHTYDTANHFDEADIILNRKYGMHTYVIEPNPYVVNYGGERFSIYFLPKYVNDLTDWKPFRYEELSQ